MKFQKLVMATSVCAALSGVSGLASADILGLPGEALLVTPVMDNGNTPGIDTYVALRVPETIGSDYIINTYSAPNTSQPGQVTVQTLDDPRIYWTLFDENSVKVEDGTCEVSPGDVVIWSTDSAPLPAISLRGLEQGQRSGLIAEGIMDRPNPVCGPTNPPRTGYAIFQTISGADGQVADFAFTADATLDLTALLGAYVGIPAVPMSDGADPLPSGTGFPIAYPGVEMNEVISGGTYGDTRPAVPLRYAPISAGIRFDNGNPFPAENRVTQMPIVGPLGGLGFAAHVYWFNLNQTGRTSYIDLWDDMEGQCSIALPVPRELNVWVYNLNSAVAAPGALGWGNLAAVRTNNRVTDLINAIDGGAYTPANYCSPEYWDAILPANVYRGALAGYAENAILEYRYATAPADGYVHTAGVQYALVENVGTTLWSGHLATDIGIQ